MTPCLNEKFQLFQNIASSHAAIITSLIIFYFLSLFNTFIGRSPSAFVISCLYTLFASFLLSLSLVSLAFPPSVISFAGLSCLLKHLKQDHSRTASINIPTYPYAFMFSKTLLFGQCMRIFICQYHHPYILYTLQKFVIFS